MTDQTESAQSTPKKEKKGLDPRIALALMIIMIICALFNGASKAWKKNRAGVEAAYDAWQENVQQRVETAYNILTVAGRYVTGDNELLAAVKNDLGGMADSVSSKASINRQAEACESFVKDANALLVALSEDQRVQQDARDSMYITLMLPQAVEQCSNSAALSAYNTSANAFNDGLRSFSGLLARLTGVDYAYTADVLDQGVSAAAQ